MPRIDWPSIGVDPRAHAAGGLDALDRSVMAGSADALQVGGVEEDHQVAPVRLSMIDDICGDHLPNGKVSLA